MSAARLCAGCGAKSAADARFCRRCGADVQSGEVASTSGDDASPAGTGSLTTTLTFGAALLGVSAVGLAAVRWGKVDGLDVEIAATAADALVIAAFAFASRDVLGPALRARLRPRVVVDVLATSVALGLFALGYFSLAAAAGLGTVDMSETFRRHETPLWAAYLLTAAAPAVTEEIAFRGVIYGRLLRNVSAREAWFAQAALFAVLHLSPFIFPSHFVIGLLLGRLRVKTGSVLPGMLVHAAYNAAVLAIDYAAHAS